LNEELISNNQKPDDIINFRVIQAAQQPEEIRLLKTINHDVIEPKKIQMLADSPRAPPSSCRQLSTIGLSLDGIYMTD